MAGIQNPLLRLPRLHQQRDGVPGPRQPIPFLEDLREAATGARRPDACIRFCPHALEVDCACRKPQPGMLHDIMRHFGVSQSETLFVGNAPSDQEAARRAGVEFARAWDFFGW